MIKKQNMLGQSVNKILAIETATETCSVALSTDGGLVKRYEVAPRKQTELILPMVDSVLMEAGLKLADLDGLAFGSGPGAFTGLRVAAGVVQGLALGANLRVAPISTLQIVAQGCLREFGAGQVAAFFDARMGEVYWGLYQAQNGVMIPLMDDQLDKPDQLSGLSVLHANSTMPWQGAGNGWCHESVLSPQLPEMQGVYADFFPHAEDILPLAAIAFEQNNVVSAADVQPVYLRESVAWKKTTK